MNNWNLIVAGMSILLLAFLLWKEFVRRNKARLGWRILATVIAVTSLAWMYLPATYSTSVGVKSDVPVALLTDGFDADSVEQFRSHHPDAAIITFDDQLALARKHKAALVSDINAYPVLRNIESPVHIFGYGPDSAQLNELHGRTLIYHVPEAPGGITSAYWKNKIRAGERFHIQGSYNNRQQQPLKMMLSGFSTTLDSVILSPGKRQQFELGAIPKHTGRGLYSLIVLSGKDTIENQPVPLQVEEAERLRVLLLAASPDFENKFLKNWLAQNGHQVTTRTIISKGRSGTDFLNTAVVPLNNITSSLLNRFDICITDAAGLAAISMAELGNIKSFVSERNLGIVIRSDSNLAKSFFSERFPVSHLVSHERQVHLRLRDTVTRFKPISLDKAFFIRNQEGTQPLLTDNHNRIFASSTIYGTGKIVFTTISNTFQWALAGNHRDYDLFWAELLKKAAGKHPEEETWRISPALPKVNEPVIIHAEISQQMVPQGNVKGVPLYLKQDAALPFRWSGTYWPLKTGWHTTVQNNGTIFWWYVYDQDDWKAVGAYKKIKQTSLFAEESSHQTTNIIQTTRTEKTEVPKVLFFFLFIVCCAFLWLENKI